MNRRPHIAIAGAGIGGLTAALALLRRGFAVTVFEQAPAFAEVGAGIQLSANGTRCLFSLGLEGEIRERASSAAGKEIRLWSTGETWKLFDLGEQSVQRYGFPYLMMHRADLHGILATAVERAAPGTVRLGSRVVGHAASGDGVAVLHLDGRQEAGFDALVGADGVHSPLRRNLFGDDAPEFTGCMAWRGLIPAAKLPERLLRPVGTNWVGPGRHVITYPVRGGQMLNFVGIVERADWQMESWNVRGTREECARDFEGWHEDVHLMIGAIDEHFKWALMGRAPMQRWGAGAVTLLGDACHPTLPFLAQGAMMAIEDGIVLARCVEASPSDLTAAFSQYEALRMGRTSQIVLKSAENARRFHNPALANADGARDYVTREWQPDKVSERYGWLFEYDALGIPLAGRAEVHAPI
jgi:salicylate hydroxylase